MPRKKKVDVPPPGAPLWMTTYGDMVTLVLTFFILMFTFSTIDKQKYIQVVNSMKGAMGGNVGVLNQGSSVEPVGTMMSIVPSSYDIVFKQLKEILEKADAKEQVEIRGDGKEIIVSFKEKLFFLIGSADILTEALLLLEKVGGIIHKQGLAIRVEGHTCDIPIATQRFPSNWELSALRAVNVAKYLTKKVGIAPVNIAVGAYGQYRPMVPNTSPENRARNRRVDIVILNVNSHGPVERKVETDGGRAQKNGRR